MTDALATLCTSLVWAGVAVYAIRRAEAVLAQWRATAPVDATASGAPFVDVPDDLLAYATSMSESWAVEDTLRVVRERYDELQDWNRVRRAIGIGALPGETV
jgi:hypothetical protein